MSDNGVSAACGAPDGATESARPPRPCDCGLWHFTGEDRDAASDFNQRLWEVAEAASDHLIHSAETCVSDAKCSTYARLEAALSHLHENESLCECGHPMEPDHLTPGTECCHSGAPDGCGCARFNESTRANNAEAAVEPLKEVARAARALFQSGLSDPARSVIFDPHGALDEIQALADALRRGGFA